MQVHKKQTTKKETTTFTLGFHMEDLTTIHDLAHYLLSKIPITPISPLASSQHFHYYSEQKHKLSQILH